jgi:hypothetical protein
MSTTTYRDSRIASDSSSSRWHYSDFRVCRVWVSLQMSGFSLCEKGKRIYLVELSRWFDVAQSKWILLLWHLLYIQGLMVFLTTHRSLTSTIGSIRRRASAGRTSASLWQYRIRTSWPSPYFTWILEVPTHLGAVQPDDCQCDLVRIDCYIEYGSRRSCWDPHHVVQVRISPFI